jgi:hypothetical protein
MQRSAHKILCRTYGARLNCGQLTQGLRAWAKLFRPFRALFTILCRLFLTSYDNYMYHRYTMKTFSTRQAANKLGITNVSLIRYIKAGKVPTPKSATSGGMTIHFWTEEQIEHVRQLLPKIANGRKTRYSKLRDKQKAQPKKAVPRKPKKK